MAVLVTRPGEQGLALCQQLERVGVEAVHHPLITIKPGKDLPALNEHLTHTDMIIAVSQHAASLANSVLKTNNHSWPTSIDYLAVGQKTAHILSKATQQKVHYPEVSDSEHLLNLKELHQVSGKHVVILRGNGGRELIFDTLVARGAKVTYIEAYKRENIAFRADLHFPIWQDKQISQIVITSSGQLNFFISQLNDQQREWIFTRMLFVPSKRIAQEAIEVGFQSVINTSSASNQDLVATLQPTEIQDNK